MTTFTYLPGPRPAGLDPVVGFGFSGNFGYWYVDFVAEQPSFTGFWLTQTDEGVRFNIGEADRWRQDDNVSDHHIDFIGATLTPGGTITGPITEVRMGSSLPGYAGDYFRIDTPGFTTAELNAALTAFRADPADNMVLYNLLTQGTQTIIGQSSTDNHGGFTDESALTSVALGGGDDIFYWQGGNDARLLIDLGDGRDLLRLYTTVDARVDLGAGSARIGTAEAVLSGIERLVSGNGNDRIIGSNRRDIVMGLDGNDRIGGQNGNDKIWGGYGDDLLGGGGGRDRLDGEAGHDTLLGGGDDDRLLGDAGRDTLDGGTGDDRLLGGGWADHFVFRPNHGNDIIRDFELGTDSLVLSSRLTGGETDAATVVAIYGRDTDQGIVLDFGGSSIRLARVHDLDALANDMIFI